jgi:hypothetical protein
MGAPEASVSQAKFVEDLRLMLKALGRFLVYGIFEEFLSTGYVVRKNAAGESELSELFT